MTDDYVKNVINQRKSPPNLIFFFWEKKTKSDWFFFQKTNFKQTTVFSFFFQMDIYFFL